LPLKLNHKIPLIFLKKAITIALPTQYLLENNILGFYSGDALELSPVLQNDHPWCGTGSGRSGCVPRRRRRRRRLLLLLLPLARYGALLRSRSFSNAAQQEDEEQAATSPSRSLPPSLVSQGPPSMYLQMCSLF